MHYFTVNIKFCFKNKRIINKWINEIIFSEKKILKNVTFIFCDDFFLSALNNKYLKHKTLTDIITFDYCEGKNISGEIYISIERVRENAIIFKNTFINELHRVMIHGILHLLGYSDKSLSERLDMRTKEDDCIIILDKLFNTFHVKQK